MKLLGLFVVGIVALFAVLFMLFSIGVFDDGISGRATGVCPSFSVDSDSGFFVKGSSVVSGCAASNVSDFCVNPCVVGEYVGSSLIHVNCLYGCVDGACLHQGVNPSLAHYCADKVGGQDIEDCDNQLDDDGDNLIDCDDDVDCESDPDCIPSNNISVYFASPSSNEILIKDRPIYLRAEKLGLDNIARVEFWKDNTKLSTDNSYPYEYYLNGAAIGNHQVVAKAYTSSGNVFVDSVSFSLKNQDPNPSYCMLNGKDECAEMFLYVNKFATLKYSYICDNDGDDVDDGDSMGWGEGYKLQGIASAYEASRNKTYLDIMRADINVLFCIEDDITSNDCAVCPFTYSGYGQTPGNTQEEWGWYGDHYSRTKGIYFEYLVGEGLMVRAIAKFIEFIKSDPGLETEYGADADIYLAKIEDLFDKWDRRGLYREVGDGSGVYLFHNDSEVHMGGRALMSLPHNQQAEWTGAMLTLYRITGDLKYRDRAAKLLYHLKKNYYTENGTVNWDYWNHAGLWDYTTSESNIVYGGLRHSEFEHNCGYKRIESEAMIEGWRNCLVFDDGDLLGVLGRLDFHATVPNELSYNCVYPMYAGFVDKSKLETSFNKLRKMDDDLGDDYPWQSIYRMESGHFFEVLKNFYPKYFICNVKEIPIYQNFDGATTNFRNVADITSVSNVVLEKSKYGKIEFGNKNLDMANLFLDAYVTIGNSLVILNGEELPVLDTSATVTLYDVNNSNPIIMKDRTVCSSCNVLSSGKDVKFTIPGAGVYKVEPKMQLLFKDDFESGTLSKWPIKNDKGKMSVTSEKSRTGSKSMKVIFDGQIEMYVQTQDFNVEDYVYKVSMMLSNDFWLGKDIRFSLGHNATTAYGKNIIMIDNKAGADIAFNKSGYDTHIYMQYSDDSDFKHWVPQNRMAGLLVKEGSWHDIEYHFKSDPDGYVDLFIDGKFIGRSVMGDTSKSKQKSFRLGIMPERIWSGSAGETMYLDNFEIYEIN